MHSRTYACNPGQGNSEAKEDGFESVRMEEIKKERHISMSKALSSSVRQLGNQMCNAIDIACI
jgi:hypothetical protein